MIKCKKCEHHSDYTGKPCVICGSEIEIDENDIEEAKKLLAEMLEEL